ncbi:RNA-directed DNA polymerase, eukaryota [Tanacetum coccineum]
MNGTNKEKETDSSPVIVLEEELRYGFLLEFDNTKDQNLFGTLKAVGSWFSVLHQASHDFTPEGRIAWVDVEGIPFKFWSGKTFKKIATKWGELLDVDDHDEMSFHSKRICIHTNSSNICENIKIVFSSHQVEREETGIVIGAKTNSTGQGNSRCLEEVPLGGSAYTWCHKSASKMSKLDRFLSDHRPILLREASFDYGPTPFRFFHFWFDVDGFDKFVTDSWKDAPGDDSNAMRNLCGKLKFLKVKIRAWYADYRNNSKGSVTNFKEELRILDELIDKGNGSERDC